jgi:hypothetical protein
MHVLLRKRRPDYECVLVCLRLLALHSAGWRRHGCVSRSSRARVQANGHRQWRPCMGKDAEGRCADTAVSCEKWELLQPPNDARFRCTALVNTASGPAAKSLSARSASRTEAWRCGPLRWTEQSELHRRPPWPVQLHARCHFKSARPAQDVSWAKPPGGAASRTPENVHETAPRHPHGAVAAHKLRRHPGRGRFFPTTTPPSAEPACWLCCRSCTGICPPLM